MSILGYFLRHIPRVRDRHRLFSKCHQYLFLFNCYCLDVCNETHISDIWIWDLYNNPCQYSEVIVGFQANIYFFRLLLFAEVSDVSMCHFTTENVNLVEKTWLYGVFHPFKFIYMYWRQAWAYAQAHMHTVYQNKPKMEQYQIKDMNKIESCTTKKCMCVCVFVLVCVCLSLLS